MNTFTRKVDEPCKRCGSYLMEFREKGPHIGQYCKCCGSFIKWVPRRSSLLADWKIPVVHKPLIVKVYSTEFESWLKMVTKIVEAEDNGQNA